MRRVKDVGKSKCCSVMVQIEVNTSFRKGADFQQVLYYKKITIRLLNWESK
jgi:hypothetical protein